jgi:UDP-N-acetylmuramate: L-alanyl-gamma-D-glutamyl-meso-diaminopimelate ligase
MKKIHLMGICGMGMGSLAGMLKAAGYDVRGSDEQVYPPMSIQLQQLGIPYFEGYQASNLDWNPDLVVVGNVITRINPEATALQERELSYSSFPRTLAEWFIRDRHSIVVTGTHGKTTTSSVLAWTLDHAGYSPGFMVGGILKNFGTNYNIGTGNYFVVEGDEYDTAYFDKVPKFVHYRPKTGIITSVEYDHADIYEDLDRIKREFSKFVALIPSDGLLVAYIDDPNVREVIQSASSPLETYGFSLNTNWTIKNVFAENGRTAFTVFYHGSEFGTLHTFLIGRHNLLNLLGSTAILHHLGLTQEEIDAGFATFQGIKRRQEVRGIVNEIVVLDDFAHHPTAVRETIAAVKASYISGVRGGYTAFKLMPTSLPTPNPSQEGNFRLRRENTYPCQGGKGEGKHRRLWSVFEPRSATTRRNVFQEDYVTAFLETDVALLADVHRPDKAPEGQRFSPDQLAQDLQDRWVEAYHLSGVENIVTYLTEHLQPGDVVLIMSNGGFGGIHDKLLTALREKYGSPG